jgi:hypothetical protein
MNRTKAGWKTWFTEALPNIGMYLARGNNKTAKVFEIAWAKYQLMTDAYEKSQPGKDQNTVLDAMRIGRGTFGFKYAYFDNFSTPLLDKLVLNHGTHMELGGEHMGSLLDKYKSLAIHTTCYEKATKVMGLKASNAFWHPKYYDPLARTITKQILYENDEKLLEEVRSLIYLAIATERSLILPNLLGPESIVSIDKYMNQAMWPGFRVVYIKKENGVIPVNVDIREPGFYWRVNRDYDKIPQPIVVEFASRKNLADVKELLRSRDLHKEPRLILHDRLPRIDGGGVSRDAVEDILVWANHSVGLFSESYSTRINSYQGLPYVKPLASEGDQLAQQIMVGLRVCNKIFGKYRGNRTCFQICD